MDKQELTAALAALSESDARQVIAEARADDLDPKNKAAKALRRFIGATPRKGE